MELKRYYDFKMYLNNGKLLPPKDMSLFNIDKNIFKVYLSLINGTKELVTDGIERYSASMIAVKPKTKEYVEKLGEIVDGRFVFDLSDCFNDQVGKYIGEFQVWDDEERITSYSFTYTVTPSILTDLNEEITSIPDEDRLIALIERVEKLAMPDGIFVEYTVENNVKKIKDNGLKTNAKDIVGAINELKQLIDEGAVGTYMPPSITSFTCTPRSGVYEIGTVISGSIKFSWSIDRAIKSQTLTGASGLSADTRSATVNMGSITSDKTFILTVNDGKTTVSKSLAFVFKYNVYYGVSSSENYNNNFVNNFSKTYVGLNEGTDFTVNAGENDYIYYCLPSKFDEPTFFVSGFEGGFAKVSTITVGNYNYDIWKSTNKNLGKTTISVK